MSSRKSKKRIGSTRQRHQVQKAEERGANEELQEASTAQHLQLSNSSETPTCQLDCVPENVEGGQHDSSKTHSENFETGALADITEAETSTSGKKRRMGSTRRAKQGLQAEETKEQEEVKSMQIVQEEFNVTGTEDQYFKEYSDAPELASDQAQRQMPELGGSEVKELGTGDESPNKQHKLLSELDHKTVTEACSTEMHSPPVPFIQSPTPVANTPVCVTGSHPEEGETHSDDTPLQNTPQELSDQQKVESAKDVSKGEEKMGAKEVQGLEGSLSQEIIMQIEKKDDKPVNEMEVESAGIQDFLLQMQDMTQKSALSSTVEKEHSQIFHPSDADIDGTVTESYNKFGNQNIIGSEQTSSIDVSQEEDENSKYNVQRLKKRMGSTRRPLKAIKPKEDIGNSQVGTQEIRDNTLQEEMSVKEDTQFREMVEFNDKLEMAFTVNVRGGELEGTGDEHTAMATEACPSTENITDGIGTSTTSSHLIMERDLDYHHNETDSEERTSIDQEEGAEVYHPGVLGEQISEHLSYHALDEETLQIVDQGQYTENTQLTPEFTTQYVDQLQQHGEINSENSLETPGRQERQSSINMEVSEQTELENKLSSPSDNSSPDSAGITIENIGVTDKTFTEYLSSQIGFGTLSEASGHSEQDHLSPSPTPHAIPESTVAQLNVHAESFISEIYSPNVQHSEKAEQGTQAHILSFTMESEVPNVSTDVPEFSHSLHVVSTDPSEASTLSDHSQSSLKLQHQEEEESVEQSASRQKKRMGSTRRTKREQKREDACGTMTTDDVSEDMNMNIDTDMKSEAEEGILPESIKGASKQDEFFTNQTDVVTLSMPLTTAGQDQYVDSSSSAEIVASSLPQCNPEEGGQRQENQDQYPAVIAEQLDGNELDDNKISILGKETAEVITTVGADLSSEAFMKDVDQVKKHEEEMSESFLEVLGDQNKENINAEASEQAESENILSSPTEDPSPDCAGTAVEDMDTSEKAVSFSCHIGVETLTCPGSPPSPSSDHIPETDTSLNVHAESSNPENPDVQHSEEADPGTQAHILSSTMESEVANISTDVPDFSHSLHVESIGPSETSTLSSHLESSFKLQHQKEEDSVQQGASRQKKRMGSTRRTKREQKKEETCGTMSTDEVNEMNIDTEITVAPLDVHAENSSPEMHSPDVQHSEEVEQGTQAHILSPTMESEVPNISTDVPDFSHSLHVESTDPSETSTLSDHSQSSLKLQHQEEEESVQQGASRQKKRMGSTRRTKREQKKEETCEAMSTDDVNEEISMNIDIDMKSDTDTDTEITAPLNVHAWNSSPEMHSPDVQHSEETEQGTQAHIDGNYLEDNNDMSILEKETPEVITTVGADLFSEAFMREDVNQLKKHEEEQSGKSHESLFDPKENRISTELSEQAEVESKQSYTTEDLSADTTVEGMDTTESPSESHTWNMESSNMAESRAAPDHWESTLRLQPVEKEGDLEPDVSRHKRKMGSTRRQKRESNEVHLDGTRSSQEVMTVVVTETDIEVQLEENLQSEQISSSENIHAACLNTIPVGFNECQMKDASKETVDEPNKQDINSQESEKEKGEKDILMIQEGKVGEHQREVDLGPPETHRAIQDDTMVKGQGRILEQIQNIVTETSVSASQYPQTEESPGLKRRRKLGSTRRSQREKTERKYVVMDGMLIHSDSEASPCRDSKSVEVEGKDEEEGKIHDIEENTEAMSCIFVNTIVIPSTPESLETNQERSNDDTHSIDEVTKEQCILASTITTAEQPPLENIAGNDNYSAHGDTLTVNSDTPPANSPSYENTLKLSPLENCDSSEESKPQKKRMGSSRKISQRQHKDKKSSHGEADVKNEDSDSVTNTVTEPIQQIKGDLCAEHIGGLEGVYNDPEDHLVPEMYVQSPLGQIDVSESSETTAVETTSSNLCEDDSQKEPKSMLQKRKMGSSRRGQGLKNKAKQAANVEDVDDISTSKQEGNDTALQNTEDLSMEGEQLLITSVQTSKSNLQPLAQAERPDELIDERVLSASAQCRTSVHSVSSSPSSELQEDNPSIDPKSTTKKKKMGSTRKNMRRQGEDEKSNLKKDQESAERCNVIDDMGDLTGAMETVTIQKVTETGESEDTLPQDEGSGHGSAGHKEVPEGTRRKMGSRRGGQGCRGIGVVRGPEDQPVSQGPENDSSVLQNTQENVNSEGVPEQGLSKLVLAGEGQFQKVEQPPSGARSKSDLDRKYGQDYTLTSLEEAVMFNVVMVGDSSVGKTSFIRRFQCGEFNEDHSATIGVDGYTQTLAVDGELVKLLIWDTAGQERFHSITRNMLHKAHGLILMYDISSCHTFTAVRKWITCIEEGAPSEVIILLLGNKNDSEDRQVLHPEGERLAQEYKIHFMECSAATGDNISQSIETLARLLKQTVKESGQGNVTLHKKPPQKKAGCC